jgi:hypothetical protein
MTSLHRTALAAIALGVLLAASGCSAPAPTPEPTVTVTVTPTATASPTSDPAPAPEPTAEVDPNAYVASDTSTWVVSFAGIGPLVVGDTFQVVQADVPAAPVTCRPGVDTWTFGGVGYTLVSGIDEQNPAAPVTLVRMVAIDTVQPGTGPRTVEGIGLGSTIAELQAARPDAVATPGQQGQPAAYQLFSDGRVVSFQDSGTGTIQMITVSSSTGVVGDICGA